MHVNQASAMKKQIHQTFFFCYASLYIFKMPSDKNILIAVIFTFSIVISKLLL